MQKVVEPSLINLLACWSAYLPLVEVVRLDTNGVEFRQKTNANMCISLKQKESAKQP